MKRAILVLACGVALASISGCSLIDSLFWPTVTLADAKEAWTASQAFVTAVYTDCVRVDNGSDPNYIKAQNSSGSLTYVAQATGGSYPVTFTFTAASWADSTSGYTFTGTLVEKVTASSTGTMTWDLGLDHATKVVKKVAGALTASSSAITGSLKFNNDSFSYAEFTAAP